VELTIRHITLDIRYTQLCSLTMTTKTTFCQLPITYCFHCQPCSCKALRLYKSPQFAEAAQTKRTTGDSCNGGISVLNHCLSWSEFVNTHLYHSRQWFNIHLVHCNQLSCYQQLTRRCVHVSLSDRLYKELIISR